MDLAEGVEERAELEAVEAGRELECTYVVTEAETVTELELGAVDAGWELDADEADTDPGQASGGAAKIPDARTSALRTADTTFILD